MNFFKIIKSTFSQKNNTINYSVDLELERIETDYYLDHSLTRLVADQLVKDLYPEFKQKIMGDKDFMLELANEFRTLMVKKIINE